MELKSSSLLSKMDSNEISILKRALAREKRARKTAENLLESKAKELYDATLHLREANGRLETLLSDGGTRIDNAFVNIIDPYVVMDMMSNVINMNTSAKEFLGYDHAKEKICLSDLVHPDYLEYTAESFQTLLQVGILKNYNAKIITKGLEERFVNINASLVYNENGSPIAAQGVIRDITHEVEIKQLLESQKKQQDIIVENSSLGILLIVKEKIIKANKAFIELLGYPEIELKKKSLNDISSLEDSNLYDDLFQKSLESDTKKFAIVRKFRKKNGKTLYGKTSMSSVLDSKGEIEYSVAMIEDITHEKISEEKLRASEERMATLIKNLQT
ncbi:MAG: PAS domain-containing protein, partial [Flavobacteriaceae bacterium]